MDVSLVTSLPPVTVSSRPGTALPDFAQATPAVLEQVSSKIDISNPTPSKAGTPGTDETSKAPSQNQLAQAIKQVNDAFSQKGQNLYASFEEDKITGIQVVKIVEKKTNEIIRQMPPKEIVAFAQSLEVEQGWRGWLILDKA